MIDDVSRPELEEARATNRLLRGVLDAMPSMLAFWDRHERCVFANRAYEKWFGVTPDWVLGRTLEELLGPIYPRNKPFIDRALAGEPQQFEREIPDPAGGAPRCSLAHYIPKVEGGTVLGFYVLVSDVTELKRVEAELRQAKLAAETALSQVKTLTGLLPMCAWCRRLRTDEGYWRTIEDYLAETTDARLSHGLCEACRDKHFPDFVEG